MPWRQPLLFPTVPDMYIWDLPEKAAGFRMSLSTRQKRQEIFHRFPEHDNRHRMLPDFFQERHWHPQNKSGMPLSASRLFRFRIGMNQKFSTISAVSSSQCGIIARLFVVRFRQSARTSNFCIVSAPEMECAASST